MKPEPLPPALKPNQIERKEWRFVCLAAIILLVITSLPYAYASLTAPADKQFMGFILNVSDHTQYLSWYKAFQSDFLISNRLTSEENPAIFFNLLWWVLAQVGKFTGLSYQWVYQILRFFSGFAFFLAAYWFIAQFFSEQRRRKFVFSLLAVSSGFGWVLVLSKYLLGLSDVPFPLDLYVAEGNTFLCLMAYPHFLEASAFILTSLGLLLVGERRNQYRWAVYAGLVAFFLGWQHGYDLIIVWSIPIFYACVRWIIEKRFPFFWFKTMLIAGLISSPPAVYNVLLTRLDPTWKEVLAQFANAGVYTPNFLHFLILMGLPLLIAIITAIVLILQAVKSPTAELRHNPLLVFLLIWFGFGWLLTYIPTDFQIHMINSWQVPVISLAGVGIFRWILPYLKKHLPRQRMIGWAGAFLIAFCALTNFYLFAWRFYDLSRNNYPYFLTRNERAALNWLEENAGEADIILSSLDVGQYIPGVSGRTAFLAHWAQTIRFYEKQEVVKKIFDPSLPESLRMQLLLDYQVDFVISGPAEWALNGVTEDPLLLWEPYYSEGMETMLEPAWTGGNVTIYKLETQTPGIKP